jgi:hypothetical protein
VVPERIYEEIAFIAYHFHWSYDEILAMEHSDRKRWCEQISNINQTLNENSNSKRVNLEQQQWL